MFSRSSKDRYGLLVDIGSGSVGLAVCTGANSAHPTVIWSHREHIPIRDITSVGDTSKAIVTTLMHSMMEFEGVGRAALHEHQAGATITTMQATVAAPWAYTTTRTIVFEQDKPFEITQELIDDLATAAGQQAIDEFNQQHSLDSLGVTESSRCVLDTYANGYRLSDINQQQATKVTVTHATALVRTEIIQAIQEMNQKLFGDCELDITSYMLANYFVTRRLLPHVYDFCLVDVTNEATELGIVRDGSLQYSTHVAFGRASLAREVATITGVPLQEAFTSLPTKQMIESNPDLQTVFNAYTKRIEELFKETGDRLTIPKNIFLETDTGLESVFKPLVQAAGTITSKGTVTVSTMSDAAPKLVESNQQDVALLVAASFFHTSGTRSGFEYL